MSTRVGRALRWPCAGVWAALIAYGSLSNGVPAAEDLVPLNRADLIQHVLAYLVLTLLLTWATRGAPVRAAVGAFAFGLAIECLQLAVGRSFDLTDLAANAFAAALGALIARWISRRRGARRR